MDHQDIRRRIASGIEDLLTQFPKARELFAKQMKRYEELWQIYLKKDSEEPQPDKDPLVIPKYPPNAPEYIKSNNPESWLKFLKNRNALEKFKEVKENLPKHLGTDGTYRCEDFEYDGKHWYAINTELLPHPGRSETWGGLDETDRFCCYYGLLARLYDIEKPNALYHLCPDSLKMILDEIHFITKENLRIPDPHDTFESTIKFVKADIEKHSINPTDTGIQGRGQSYREFLLDIAGQVHSLIKKNRPCFEQQVQKFETYPDMRDTLIERDESAAILNPWQTQRDIDYNKNGKKVSDRPGEETCTKEESELRQYYLLSVIHAFMTNGPTVVDRNSNLATSVWDRFNYQRFTTMENWDRSDETAFIKIALKDVQDDIKTIPASKGGAGNSPTIQKRKNGWTFTFEGQTATVDSKLDGLRYLETLLTHPNKTFSASELRASILPKDVILPSYRNQDTLDSLSFKDIRKSIEKLEQDKDSEPDPAKQAEIQEQIDQLIKHRQSATNKKGEPRVFSEDNDRNAIRRAIKTVKDKIESDNIALFNHLEAFLDIGFNCNYHPEKNISWEIS